MVLLLYLQTDFFFFEGKLVKMAHLVLQGGGVKTRSLVVIVIYKIPEAIRNCL